MSREGRKEWNVSKRERRKIRNRRKQRERNEMRKLHSDVQHEHNAVEVGVVIEDVVVVEVEEGDAEGSIKYLGCCVFVFLSCLSFSALQNLLFLD